MSMSTLKGLLQSNLVLGTAAVAAGVLAAWLGARHLSERTSDLERRYADRYAAQPYIVASRDLPRGQKIDASVLSIRSIPRSFAPPDALPPSDATRLIGGRSAIEIRRGTPVVAAAVSHDGVRGRLSEILPEGMRALSIQVDQLNSLSGHLEAGDTVDLYYSRPRGSETVLLPLLQRVRVLATGDVTQAQLESGPNEQQGGDFSAVTLLVSATDSRRVVLAEQTGRLTLILRRPSDEGVVDSRSVLSSELLRSGTSTAGKGLPRSAPVEVLVGGNGSSPSRTWLSPGEDA